MIDQIQRDADQKHFEAWMDSRGNKGKFPPLEYVWHAACAYARRTLADAAESIRRQFPQGSFVKVDAPTFHGVGFLDWRDYTGPYDKLPVKIENGNVWWYHIAHCERVADVKTAPRAIRRLRLLCAGIGTA